MWRRQSLAALPSLAENARTTVVSLVIPGADTSRPRYKEVPAIPNIILVAVEAPRSPLRLRRTALFQPASPSTCPSIVATPPSPPTPVLQTSVSAPATPAIANITKQSRQTVD